MRVFVEPTPVIPLPYQGRGRDLKRGTSSLLDTPYTKLPCQGEGKNRAAHYLLYLPAIIYNRLNKGERVIR